MINAMISTSDEPPRGNPLPASTPAPTPQSVSTYDPRPVARLLEECMTDLAMPSVAFRILRQPTQSVDITRQCVDSTITTGNT